MVGMRASCQPMPVLMMVAPAASIACGERDDLVQRGAAVDQVEHREPVDDDEVRARPRSRMRRTISTGKRIAVLVRAAPAVGAAGWCAAAMNSLIR